MTVVAADVAGLAAGAEVVISVLPPQFAMDIARLVSAEGFSGTYLDANPISPATAAEIAGVVTAAGATFVDGGIVGPPPHNGASTSLYLAGDAEPVGTVRRLFTNTDVTATVVGNAIGQASVAKLSYALYNKGRMVLAAAAARLADVHGVREVLAGESSRPGADLLGELDEVLEGLAGVGWRWGPEFEEVAAALRQANIEPAVARAIAGDLQRLGSPPAPG